MKQEEAKSIIKKLKIHVKKRIKYQELQKKAAAGFKGKQAHLFTIRELKLIEDILNA